MASPNELHGHSITVCVPGIKSDNSGLQHGYLAAMYSDALTFPLNGKQELLTARVFSGQVVHASIGDVAPSDNATCPCAHVIGSQQVASLVHSELTSSLNFPAGHNTHVPLLPNRPAPQPTQASDSVSFVAPLRFVLVKLPQFVCVMFVQLFVPPNEYLPAGQALHIVWITLYVPGLHGVHPSVSDLLARVCPSAQFVHLPPGYSSGFENCPAGQYSHLSAWYMPYLPAGHNVHSEFPVSLVNEPRGQMTHE